MKIAIIGAGYTGMSMAKKLTENGVEVVIYEKSPKVGGMTKCIEVGEQKTDQYYRHLFKTDYELKELAKELGIEIKKFKGKMGYYIQNQLYDWGQPITLLTFKPLNFAQKIRFGISIIKLKLIKNWNDLEKNTIEEWYRKNKKLDIYEIIWKPLLNNKFGSYASKISMTWLWGKINLRSSENSWNKEILGYIENFEGFNQKLQEYLENKGVTFKLETTIDKIHKIDNQYIINTDTEKYDFVVSTVSYPITEKIFKEYLTEQEKLALNSLEYVSSRTMILKTKGKLTDYYWLNIADDKFPFCGIVDYHNMEDISALANKDMIYISNYLESTSPLYQLTDEELFNTYLPYLRQINPSFNEEDILDYKVIKEDYAQPIISKNYSNKLLGHKLEEAGLYVNTLPQIYPEDRGVNYAIHKGYEVAKEIFRR